MATGSTPGQGSLAHPKAATEAMDLVSGLWQESPFPRLPEDAPLELQKHVYEVHNPRRLYTIHRACRRHDFQLLVDSFISQLRFGCDTDDCTTATCFSCRKRIAGPAPLRRYNTTSARALAVYLASQENPYSRLCPNLRQSGKPASSLDNLVFSARNVTQTSKKDAAHGPSKADSHHGKDASSYERPTMRPQVSTSHSRGGGCEIILKTDEASRDPQLSTGPSMSQRRAIEVSEKPVSRDYRSFTASAFGTVAFKMLEWLTPMGTATITKRVAGAADDRPSSPPVPAVESDDPARLSVATDPARSQNNARLVSSPDSPPNDPSISGDQLYPTNADCEPAAPQISTIPDKRQPKSSAGTPSTSKTSRRKYHEPTSPPFRPEDTTAGPRGVSLDAAHQEKLHRNPKRSITLKPRGVPEMPTRPAFFENVPAPPLLTTSPICQGVLPVEPARLPLSSARQELLTGVRRNEPSQAFKESGLGVAMSPDVPSEHCAEIQPPQTLRRFDVNIINFVCEVFEQDQTAETHASGDVHQLPPIHSKRCQHTPMKRRVLTTRLDMKAQWKLFNEQAIYSVLTDPSALVASFTMDERLFDSHTLWYCMRRLVSVAPSLVFHSLWSVAGSLFIPPKSLQPFGLPEETHSSSIRRPLSEIEAGCIMSICLHALVAAVPLTKDSRSLYEMSRIRASGLSLSGTGPSARQPASLCLAYDDALSNSLALRLARRLCTATVARRLFANVADNGLHVQASDVARPDILQPLLDQLDLLGSSVPRVLEFTEAEHLLHETRVPTLVLDWARAILMGEWDGRSDFGHDSAFNGALSIIKTLYENRNALLLGDIQFRVDYLSERLDSMELPVAWLDFDATQRRRHILEFPFIFNPEALVSFFRSINFSRMSRTFEESSSLTTRMAAIVKPGSLITNAHHKVVLQDLLKTATAKYLILEIGRDNVLRDAFDQLWRRERRELLRPLKVHLGEDRGEEGFDSGGVQQEFFRMAMTECLDPDYGAFCVDERTHMAWFAPSSVVELWRFEMMGLLVSLAVFNGLTLPVTFPKALYRKLLGYPVTDLHHIGDGWPDLASGLTALLEWDEKDGLVEDVFARTYEFSVSAWGSHVSRKMTKRDSSWPSGIQETPNTAECYDVPLVDNSNRDDFVTDYIRYLTDVSVRPQFEAFERGFRACLADKALSLLSPAILQSVVEGVQDIDIAELRRYSRYVGWDSSHHTVKDFWSIVRKYDDRMKRKLLEFVTASDRVPVGGIRNLQFVIQRNGEEDGIGARLPTAYTCYGTLLLPEYKDKDSLKDRLGMALENSQGFGFA